MTNYDNYKFEFEFDDTTINIKLTDTEKSDLYETTINQDDITVKPIKRFILMINKALSHTLNYSVSNYSVSIYNDLEQIICYFNYCTEMFEIEERIVFTKVETIKPPLVDIPDEFNCPITLDIMDDPVLCDDGYTYERSAIQSIRNSLSPMTRQPIDKTRLIPNRALKDAINRFISLSDSRFQTELLEKEKEKKQERDVAEIERKEELVEIERKREIELKEREKDKEKIKEFRRLREERLLYEKYEQDMKIKLEREKRQEEIKIEQDIARLKQENIMMEKGLIAKYNNLNPSFIIGREKIHDNTSNSTINYWFETSQTPRLQYVFPENFLNKIKQDGFLIKFKKLVKDYTWINKYVNGANPYLEFIFDEIIPNIDAIIHELSNDLKEWERAVIWTRFNQPNVVGCSGGSGGIFNYVKSTLELYTGLKTKIPTLKSKEYYIVNQTEFNSGFNRDLLNADCTSGVMTNVERFKYHNLRLTWTKMKKNTLNSFVVTINYITTNRVGCRFDKHNNEIINIIDSHKEYVFHDTYENQIILYTPRKLTKDYDFNHFEPFMLLAKNIIDITEEIKPEYVFL